MKDKRNKSFLIFDLDGVIFDSKKNMELAWNKTSKKFKLKVSFKSYFQKIGMPFLKILKTLGIEQNPKIYKCFREESLKNINLIKPYKDVLKVFKLFEKQNIKFSIVTSKDYKRSKFLLKKFKINPTSIHCPNKKMRGKPHPDQLIYSLKRNNFTPKYSYFIGDTNIDFLAAKRAKMNFIFAKYGYGKNNKLYKNKISNFKEIKKFIKK
ncbi:HAD family hydrolase [Candidatus Pelagibacter sp. FZCC0015]|uniref:HAD family hydrolase n=1 Tax=Candidatus Pelagibacter sp. FZCC0015 TaxID=2268451 RepID=UPI0011A576EF|nr:HAD family hydrolase [Candidatus Pelagibacter sp. FZCC0015]